MNYTANIWADSYYDDGTMWELYVQLENISTQEFKYYHRHANCGMDRPIELPHVANYIERKRERYRRTNYTPYGISRMNAARRNRLVLQRIFMFDCDSHGRGEDVCYESFLVPSWTEDDLEFQTRLFTTANMSLADFKEKMRKQ